ncbi:MAG TPA: serine/threonine-protein kinase, partial [Kofleriaceae bacterium]|nr:serine/threonine-protein kinase [Kofleriaceae bacterium]
MSFDPPASGSFPQAPPAPSLVGEVIDGRYRIFKKLGEGGMGEVYAAEHVHIDKKFALKLLKAEIVSNSEAVKRFQQEARSSSSIKHRNIIAVEDFGRLPDGRIYMCMELLGGAPLNDMIQQPMAADRLLNILIQAGHGLAAAHAKGIVHRDMKPENIYVTQDASGDVPKLLDFGIAKVAGNDGQNNLTRTGTIFGTPFYMAPEQALGQQVDG